MARLAGVSQATVSYVLNRREGQSIREETRSRVLLAARELGYQPNLAARTLVTGKTGMIALWVPYSYHSVFNHVIEQVIRLSREVGLHVVIVQIHGETSETLGPGGVFSNANVDGIIALDASGLINDIIARHPMQQPIVSIGPAYSVQTDHVGVDLRGGSEIAVGHLLDIGCRRIAYAGFKNGLVAGDPRYDAYVGLVAAAGMTAEIIRLEKGEYDDSRCAIREHIDRHGCPDGIFCWNDEVAIGASRGLADIGKRVPEDIAIIGSDGIRETEFAIPSISTVVQPFREMCETAWNFLLRRIEDPDLPIQSAVLPMRLEPRASTARQTPRARPQEV